MRYFVNCRYKGTHYHGWQRQPDTAQTIQQQLEDAISLVTRSQTTIVGCGRTDAGVHASTYYFHFDTDYRDADLLLYKVNQIVPSDIHCASIQSVVADAHARFQATERGYSYYISKQPDPFRQDTCYVHFRQSELSLEGLQSAADLVLGEYSFETFCKAHTDVLTKLCLVKESRWVETETEYIYTVRADRFLRGMIRLVVGMCINVSRGKLTLAEVTEAIAQQKRLSLDWSVPGKGLFLDHVEYDWDTISLSNEHD